MVFHNETFNGKVLFEELDIGDVFVTNEQQVFMKTENITTNQYGEFNAVCLCDGNFVCFWDKDYVSFAEADLHYTIQR